MAVKTEPGTRKEGQDHRQNGESSSGDESERSKRRGKGRSPLIPKKKRQALGDGPPEDPSSTSSEDSDSSERKGGRRHPRPDPEDEGRASHEGETWDKSINRLTGRRFQFPQPNALLYRGKKIQDAGDPLNKSSAEVLAFQAMAFQHHPMEKLLNQSVEMPASCSCIGLDGHTSNPGLWSISRTWRTGMSRSWVMLCSAYTLPLVRMR